MPNENNPAGPSFGATPEENLESSKSHARHAAEDLKAAAQAKAEELRGKAEDYYGQARGRAEEYYGQARERATSFQKEGEEYVRENPMRAVMVALGAGFVLGLVFRR